VGSVTNTLIDGTGRGLENVTVRISLIAPLNPFLLDGTGEVIQKVAVDTDHDGSWTATLTANDSFEATDTYYLVDETDAPHGMLWTIRMPEGTDTYTLRSLLITPPSNNGTPPFQYSLDDLTDVNTAGEAPGDVLTYSSNNVWVPGPPSVQPLEYPVNVPTKTWTWQHNLGHKPLIDVLNSQGEKVIVYVRHVDDNTVEVDWGAPATGSIEAR
jgi:hypothetical protein